MAPILEEFADSGRSAARNYARVEIIKRLGLAFVIALGVPGGMSDCHVEAFQQVKQFLDVRADIGIGVEEDCPLEWHASYGVDLVEMGVAGALELNELDALDFVIRQ